MQQLRRRYTAPGFGQALDCMFNERLLIEWMLWKGMRVASLPDQRIHIPWVCTSLAQGAVDLGHPWHVPPAHRAPLMIRATPDMAASSQS